MLESTTDSDQQTEIERLRARVAALEQELLEQAERTARIVAETQERTYWLDRWHLDVNALMARRGAREVRALIRMLRGVMRAAKRAKRALLGES
jgi:hypothetical protein